MSVSRLMIVMAEREWTLAALHLGCAMSRRNQTDVVLLKMVSVRHPVQLGTEAGLLDFTEEDRSRLADMAATAEDYGVSIEVEVCQYTSYWRAVVQAADQLRVTAVILNMPPAAIPAWNAALAWWLRRRLAQRQQLLITLDDLASSLTWTPSITLQEDLAFRLESHRVA